MKVFNVAPDVANIEAPAPLRNLPFWMCWRFEQFHGEAKPRKIPFWADGTRRHGEQGAPHDLARLATFAVAREAAIKHGFDGVGFAHTSACGVITLDFDVCVNDGVVRPDVLDLVRGTYAEFSPSGKGIHATFFGPPDVLHNHKMGTQGDDFAVEAFSSKGFTTFTGWALEHVEQFGYENHVAQLPESVAVACKRRFGATRALLNNDDFMLGRERALDISVEQIEHILTYISPDCSREDWIRIGMALQLQFGGDYTGLMLWDEWSSDGVTYPGFDEVEYQWLRFRGPTPGRASITMATVIDMAKKAGYRHTKVETNSRPNPVPCQFKLLDRAAIMAQPPLRWRVKGVLPETGVGAIYGPSGSGKSFLGFDLSLAIALGKPWFGHRTASCSVTYIILEGEAGLRNRVQAWEAHSGADIPDGFKAMTQPFQLAEHAQVEELGALLPSGGVVVIDTLNRAAPGLDENSSKDMGDIIAGMKRLQEVTGGLVVVVHHTGKDTSKGLRGHSSLFAALDGAIEVERNATSRSWSAAKVKDGEDGKQVPFKLQVVDLGIDADGDMITSCAVSPDAEALTRPATVTGKHQKRAVRVVTNLIAVSSIVGKAGTAPGTKCVTFEEALEEAASSLIGVEPRRRVTTARSALQGLIEGGHFRSRVDEEQVEWVWL